MYAFYIGFKLLKMDSYDDELDDSSEEVDEENAEIDGEMSAEEFDENDINESIVSGEVDYYGKMTLCGVVF